MAPHARKTRFGVRSVERTPFFWRHYVHLWRRGAARSYPTCIFHILNGHYQSLGAFQVERESVAGGNTGKRAYRKALSMDSNPTKESPQRTATSTSTNAMPKVIMRSLAASLRMSQGMLWNVIEPEGLPKRKRQPVACRRFRQAPYITKKPR